MEVKNFLKLVKKYIYLVIGVPVITAIVAYFIVRQLPDTYISKGSIATNIVAQSTQQEILSSIDNLQESRVTQQFSNLIESMRMKRIMDLVSYQLIIHDLSENDPFLPLSKDIKALSPAQKKTYLEEYKALYKSHQEISPSRSGQEVLYRLLVSMGYDEASLNSKMRITRVSNSDFLEIEFQAESPYLSAFVINALCKEFLDFNSVTDVTDKRATLDWLLKLLKEKYDKMMSEMNELKNYKIRNRILNLNEQARTLYGQIAEFETRRRLAMKDIEANEAALEKMDSKFDPSDRKYIESVISPINSLITKNRALLQKASDSYIRSNYDTIYRIQIDSIKEVINEEIKKSTDKNAYSPLASKQELVSERLKLEIALELAKNSVKSLTDEIKRLNIVFDRLVPHEAVVQGYESSIDIASREYLELLQKYNQTSMETGFTNPMKQTETADLGVIQPSKKIMIILFCTAVSFILVMLIIFIVFYFDNAIRWPKELANRTGAAVIGYMPTLPRRAGDVSSIWTDGGSESLNVQYFKDTLRSTRFEVESQLQDDKILVINSLNPQEGKTFVSVNLAHSYALINKRVLLIDGNFTNPSITKAYNSSLFIEDYLQGRTTVNTSEPFTVMGNKGSDLTLLEISDDDNIKQKFATLAHTFDVILIDTSAVTTMNKSKEWLPFADKAVTIFEAGRSIREYDEANINYLKALDKKWLGWIMNRVVSSGKKKNRQVV